MATSVRCGLPTAQEILYETADRDEIAALAAARRSSPPSGAYCMCMGTLVFEFEGTRPEAITLHHGIRIRWEGS